ncbi:MAG: hypothetical protein ACE3L7_30045 [Candidatus Pristimantibacillus sp.]
MKKMMLIIMICCCLITGCSSGEGTVTFVQIKDLFEQHGVPLVEQTEVNPESVFGRTYNDVSPERFSIDENESISIYVYLSSKAANKGFKEFEDKTATAGVVPHTIHRVGNVLLFHITDSAALDKRVERALEDLQSLTNKK